MHAGVDVKRHKLNMEQARNSKDVGDVALHRTHTIKEPPCRLQWGLVKYLFEFTADPWKRFTENQNG